MTDERIERVGHYAKWLLDATPQGPAWLGPQPQHADKFHGIVDALDSLERELTELRGRNDIQATLLLVQQKKLDAAREELTELREVLRAIAALPLPHQEVRVNGEWVAVAQVLARLSRHDEVEWAYDAGRRW